MAIIKPTMSDLYLLEKRILQSQVEKESIEADLSSLFPKVSYHTTDWLLLLTFRE